MKSLLSALAASVALLAISARADSANGKPQWHFPVHVGYVSGVSDILDTMTEGGYMDDNFEWPVGVSLQPYVMFPNGLGVGLDVGPFVMVGVEFDGDDDWDGDELNTILPLGLYVRYDFRSEAPSSPYVRAGVRQYLVSGDYIENGDPGVNIGVGFEFMRDRRVSFGVEASYDSAEVDVWQIWQGRYHSVRPLGVTASFFVAF